MVAYIGVAALQRLLAQVGTAAFLDGLAQALEADYRRWDDFDKSARHAVYVPEGVMELMPISDAQCYAFKYVNGHPHNTAQGLLTVMALGVLADVRTGYPLLLSELTLTTALRTAAMSALVARYLARPGSQVMAVIGNGAQSEFQIIAFASLLGVREFRLFDIDSQATDKLLRNLQSVPGLGIKLLPCNSVAQAVQGSDIVTTLTADKRHAQVLTPEMIAPGMYINAVGGDCPGKTELHPDIFKRPDMRVVVEFAPQTRSEGEIQQLPADFPVTEFAAVLAGTAPGRSSSAEVTVFDSVGFALEDYSALRYLYRLQQDHALAQTLDLIPSPADPKNLFGLLNPKA